MIQWLCGWTHSLLLVWLGLIADIGSQRHGTVKCPNDGNLTTYKGILMSPGFPQSRYEPRTVCTWMITAPRGGHVKLAITSMELEYCSFCRCDYVEVRDGPTANSQLIGRFCDTERANLYSEGRHMWVKFRSDVILEYKGFSASFSYVKLQKKAPFILQANASSQLIASSKSPAVCGTDKKCIWIIFAREGCKVQISLKSFSFLNCLGPFLEIRDGPSSSSPSIGRFCGDEKPPLDIFSIENSLWITFGYKSTRDLQMNSFQLLYREECTSKTQTGFFTEPLNSDHWKSMAVGIGCTSLFVFVVLVWCFLKIASNAGRFVEFERTTSLIEQNPTESSIAETCLTNDRDT